MDVDSALAQVGGFRRWNVAMYFLVAFSFNIPLCWHALSIVFTGWEPHHSCKALESRNTHTNMNNYSEYLNKTMSRLNLSKTNESQSSYDLRCRLKTINSETGEADVENCDEWSFDNDGYYTIVEQWNLVCDQNYLAELSQTLYQIGSLVGELMLFVVDKYGRKKLHIISHLAICLFGVINAFSVTYAMFAITKAITGVFVAINITSGCMLILEFFDSKHRTLPGILLQCFWSLSCILLPGLAYFITKWSHLQLAISLASPVLASLIMLIPESPTWLLSKGKHEKAEKVLRDLAKWNNVKIDKNTILIPKVTLASSNSEHHVDDSENATSVLKHNDNNNHNNNGNKKDDLIMYGSTSGFHDTVKPVVGGTNSKFRHLLDPVILKFLVITSLLWFSTCLVFYGLILATPSLEGNRFVNFILMGLVEWPATFVAYYFSNRVGRSLTSSVALFISGCLVSGMIFIPSEPESMIWLKLAIVVVSKGFITVTFAIMVLYTKEIFPTNLRATCCGICQIFGRVGELLAPMAVYLIKTNFYWLPNILFGLVSVTVSFLLLLLPETNNKHLPETVEDCHKLNSRK